MKHPRITLGGFLDKRITLIKADFDAYGLTDIPSWRNRVRANALKEMRALDLSTFQWAALKETAQEMFKENRTVGPEDAVIESASSDVTGDGPRSSDSESQEKD